MIELNKNQEPKYVTSKQYSYSALMRMTKDELIDLLKIAQHNYEGVNERLFNSSTYLEKLDKALDKACELIAEAVNQDCTIFDEVLESPYLYRTEAREWKEGLLDD